MLNSITSRLLPPLSLISIRFARHREREEERDFRKHSAKSVQWPSAKPGAAHTHTHTIWKPQPAAAHQPWATITAMVTIIWLQVCMWECASYTENIMHTFALFQSQVCCLVVYGLHGQLPSKRLLTIGNVIWAYLPMQTVKYYVNEQQEKKSDRFALLNIFKFIQYCTKAHHLHSVTVWPFTRTPVSHYPVILVS